MGIHKFALILGHPGHELRVHRFVELYRPKVYILTDGSGSTGSSRLATTLKILDSAGAHRSDFMSRYTDHDFYKIILRGNLDTLDAAVDEIAEDLIKNEITSIAGDALEGFNPTHDICRYMINAIASRLDTFNFDFTLEGPPNTCPPEFQNQAIAIELTAKDFERKMMAAEGYGEIKLDIDKAIEAYGKTPFMKECLRPVMNTKKIKAWEEEMPFYESYGLSKVKAGQYRDVISFEQHVRPIAEHLRDLGV